SCRAAPPPAPPAAATATPAPAAVTPAASVDARFNLGTHHRVITSSSAPAQQAFDRGLVLSFAFNHRAAEREFRKVAELDPASAMAWWGVALVNGPHINNPTVSPEA